MLGQNSLRILYGRAAENTAGHAQVPVAFFEITRDMPDEIVSQLVGTDAVHQFGTRCVDELREYRLGGHGFNKTALGLIDENGKVHAAIYVEKNYRPVSAGMDLRGDVKSVLSARVEECKAAPESLIFYSITNMSAAKGMGPALAMNMHPYLTAVYPGAVLSTLSPMRDISRHIAPEDVAAFRDLPRHEKDAIVYGYMGRTLDPVQKFHMGNGAVPVAIRYNADTEGKGLQVMVNYHYHADPHRLARNSEIFRSGGVEGLLIAVRPQRGAPQEDALPPVWGGGPQPA